MKSTLLCFLLMFGLRFQPEETLKSHNNIGNLTSAQTTLKHNPMKVKRILDGFSNPPLELISETLDLEIETLSLEQVNWEEFPYKPEVSVQIASNDDELFLQFKVNEQSVKATETQNNGRVWTDSCVEFFLSPEGNDEYYNLEINCIGTILLGHRKNNQESVHASAEIIGQIRRSSSLGDSPFPEIKGQTEWQITVAIPWETFFKHELKPVSGKNMRGNFYKCGDKLSVPHFVSWTRIKTEKPNFHKPEFFGGLEFE